jgi:transcriptional regulator with XRE-family HTH domain
MLYGARIEAARAIAGVTQTELATATSVKQPLISMMARGERTLSEEYATRFAEAMALPVEFFSIPPSGIPDSSVDMRKLKTASTKDSERARTLFKEAYRVSSALVSTAEVPRPTLPIVQDRDEFLAAGRIEEIAVEVRRRLRLDPAAVISDMTATLERHGIVVAPLVVPGAKESGDQTKHFGASHWAGANETALASYVPGSSGDRDRFTLAHELSHIVLHTFRTHVEPGAREGEANLLAAAILLPRVEIAETIGRASTLRNLAASKARWGVSMQAIIMRGKAVGSLPEDRASILFRQISARGWRKNEPVDVAHEQPRLLRNLLEARYGSDPHMSKSAVSELALPSVVLQSLAPQVRQRNDLGSVAKNASAGSNVIRADFVRSNDRSR